MRQHLNIQIWQVPGGDDANLAVDAVLDVHGEEGKDHGRGKAFARRGGREEQERSPKERKTSLRLYKQFRY